MQVTTRSGFTALLVGVAFSVQSLSAFAQEMRFVGTWVLDPAQSKAPLVPSSSTVVISDVGGGKFKSVSDTAAGGQHVHSELTFAVDGRDYPLQTNPTPPAGVVITQSFSQLSATRYQTTLKLRGQEVASTLQELGSDGKTMKITSTAGTNASMSTVLVYNRR